MTVEVYEDNEEIFRYAQDDSNSVVPQSTYGRQPLFFRVRFFELQTNLFTPHQILYDELQLILTFL